MLAAIDPSDLGGVIVLLLIFAVVIPIALASLIFWIWMLSF